ncbi:MAG: restriction endonuclease [Sulfitobacter sp.]|nr:restriction endonuclease [Sulfitobacter sp.]
MNAAKASSGPDILEVIADLSNDEVFTPPSVANAVLDLLPDDVWTNPDLRWLDAGSKTGVFPREITRRLMDGLSDVIPDEQQRLDHILHNQVFAIAITELTSLMSRRTLYCSKTANSAHSVSAMRTEDGNIWFGPVKHTYSQGRCAECRASEALMEKPGSDNHAYAFIHADGRLKLKKDMDMKFDVIVGNPPYQMTGGGGGGGHSPIFDQFVEEAKALDPQYISMVIPSRWMAGGRGLSPFREAMLSDDRVRRIVDYPNSAEVFPSVDIKSGVCFFLWDRDNAGPCEMTLIRDGQEHGPTPRKLDEFDILVRDSRALTILHKVQALNEPVFSEKVTGAVPFGLTSNFGGYKKDAEPGAGQVLLYASTPAGKRNTGAVQRALIKKNVHLIDHWKLLIPKAGPGSSGGHVLPDAVLGKPLVAKPKSVCTETFLPFGPLASCEEAESVMAYLQTRFARFMISLRKVSQDAMRGVYVWLPQQTWDHEWSDDELYEKYGINADEQAYIAEMIRE